MKKLIKKLKVKNDLNDRMIGCTTLDIPKSYKPLSTILREQKVNEKIAMMRTKTPTKGAKTYEHKPDNNIRLQITIDCRIL